MGRKIVLVSLVLGLLLSPTFSGEKNRRGLSLRETFDLYVRSIQSSNLEGLFSTVTDKESFFFLTSTGRLIKTREGYRKFHEDWFKEKNWEMPVDEIEVHEGTDYGYTTAIFHYKIQNPAGGISGLDSYFTLIFHREDRMWKVVADVCTPIGRYSTEANPEIKYTSDQQYLFNIIKSRRTVRKYKPTPVPKEHIIKILDSARYAPTSGNQQPWKFLVVQDRDKLDRLKKEACDWYLEEYKKRTKPSAEALNAARDKLKNIMENVLSAPVYIAVLADSQSKYSSYNVYDGSLAAGYLMIAARALGYGTGFFTSYFPEARMKKFFDIPEQYKLICFTPVGIPEEWPPTPAKKALDEFIVFENFK